MKQKAYLGGEERQDLGDDGVEPLGNLRLHPQQRFNHDAHTGAQKGEEDAAAKGDKEEG